MIPVNEPLFKGNELKYVSECINTAWVSSSGRFIDEFERLWAKYCGMKYGVTVCNGTAALESAIAVCDFPKGSEIILPSFTIISCCQAILKAGYVPVLVDCDRETFCMDIKETEQKITNKTVAIMPVHIYGHPVDMDAMKRISDEYKLVIIEDAAECHGGEVLYMRGQQTQHWRRCGGLGDISCFSFYANKIITTGEGGMVLTNDYEIARRLRDYKNLYFQSKQRFLHEAIGNNFRLTNIQAAIGLAQFEQIDSMLEHKRMMADMYNKGLKGLPLQLPIEKEWAKNVYWMYAVVLDDDVKIDAAIFAKLLRQKGVDTRPFFLGMHEQPVFHKMGLFKGERYPVCERISRRGLYLPSGQAITDEQIEEVCRALNEIFETL